MCMTCKKLRIILMKKRKTRQNPLARNFFEEPNETKSVENMKRKARPRTIDASSSPIQHIPDHYVESVPWADSILGRAIEYARMNRLVGNTALYLLTFIVAISHILEQRLSIILIGKTAAGKTTFVEMILSLIPYDLRKRNARVTGAFLERTKIDHKTVFFDELDGTGDAEYQIRQMMSLSEYSVGKCDKVDGGYEGKETPIKCYSSFITTTVGQVIDAQNENRALSVLTDSSSERIGKVLGSIAQEWMGQRVCTTEEIKELRKQVESEIETLKGRKVIIPFAGKLAELVPHSETHILRDFNKLCSLISIVTQIMRPTGDQLVSTIQDYYIVQRISEDAFHHLLKKGSEQYRSMLRSAKENLGSRVFTRSELAAIMNAKQNSVDKLVKKAIAEKMIAEVDPGSGTKAGTIRLTTRCLCRSGALPDVSELITADETIELFDPISESFISIVGVATDC